jgi:hypothetical protein
MYVPLFAFPLLRSGESDAFPLNEEISERLFRLLFCNSISTEDQELVLDTIMEFGGGVR